MTSREVAAPAAIGGALRAIVILERALTTGAFATLVVVIFADVLWRWTTGSGIFWAREVGVFANIVLTIIGIGLASADGTHLRPRFFDRLFPASWDRALTRIQELLTALAFAALCWIASRVLAETIALEDRSIVLRWVVWPIQVVLPLAFGLASLRHACFGIWLGLRPAERSEADVEAPAVRP